MAVKEEIVSAIADALRRLGHDADALAIVVERPRDLWPTLDSLFAGGALALTSLALLKAAEASSRLPSRSCSRASIT